MPPTTALYRVRPGYASDVRHVVDIFTGAFRRDSLMNILFPARHDNPAEFRTHIYRFFRNRYWTPGYTLALLVDDGDGGRPVGATWWRRPVHQLSFYERWISPYAWCAPVMRALFAVQAALFPLRSFDAEAAGTYARVFTKLEPGILNTPRRREAWYLATLIVDPDYQGRGLGAMLLQDGLAKARGTGNASWLVGVAGTDKYYSRYGFEEVARANVGELKEWDGGIVMFADDVLEAV